MKSVLLAVFVSLSALPVWTGLAPAQVQELTDTQRGVIGQKKVKAGALLLDVRTQEEFDAAHLKGAKLIPIQVLSERLGELPKNREMVVYCRSGARSAKAAELLRAKGFQVFDMGAMSNWPAK